MKFLSIIVKDKNGNVVLIGPGTDRDKKLFKEKGIEAVLNLYNNFDEAMTLCDEGEKPVKLTPDEMRKQIEDVLAHPTWTCGTYYKNGDHVLFSRDEIKGWFENPPSHPIK